MTHRPLRYVAAAVLTVAAIAAYAHAHPTKTTPEPNSIVSSPAQVSIEFSEGLEPKLSSIQLTNEAGTVVSKASSAVDAADAKHMTLALPALAPAVYTVKWVSVATDGHKLEGSYKFTVK